MEKVCNYEHTQAQSESEKDMNCACVQTTLLGEVGV